MSFHFPAGHAKRWGGHQLAEVRKTRMSCAVLRKRPDIDTKWVLTLVAAATKPTVGSSHH